MWWNLYIYGLNNNHWANKQEFVAAMKYSIKQVEDLVSNDKSV